jgi:N6-L-threonylcarbamoyladenine synthase
VIVLGIETTCDETSAAVVAEGPRLLAQALRSQSEEHRPYGGVVPELASRSHVRELTAIVDRTLADAGVAPEELAAIAVAHRPGLIGALLVGVTTAKALAWAWQKPLVAVHHLEAHLEAADLGGNENEPPYLGVVLSGGHTDLYRVDLAGRERIGATRDDAIGEAFYKVAAILGLGYPGGPAVERAARSGDPAAVTLPRTLLGAESLDFSFSGVKTAVLYRWRGQDARGAGPAPNAPRREDLCAAFQESVAAVLIEKIGRALDRTGLDTVVFGGGVTANRALRSALAESLGGRARLVFPPPEFSTDNAAMIAARGLRLLREGRTVDLDLEPEASP